MKVRQLHFAESISSPCTDKLITALYLLDHGLNCLVRLFAAIFATHRCLTIRDQTAASQATPRLRTSIRANRLSTVSMPLHGRLANARPFSNPCDSPLSRTDSTVSSCPRDLRSSSTARALSRCTTRLHDVVTASRVSRQPPLAVYGPPGGHVHLETLQWPPRRPPSSRVMSGTAVPDSPGHSHSRLATFWTVTRSLPWCGLNLYSVPALPALAACPYRAHHA